MQVTLIGIKHHNLLLFTNEYFIGLSCSNLFSYKSNIDSAADSS